MIQDNVIYQDNQSAIRLEKNGKRSSSKRKRHIKNRCYLITDMIINQEASVEFCPTFDMIGYHFTKALQGYQFRRFCNIVLGVHEDDIPAYNASGRALIEERKLRLKREKNKSQEASKISGDQGSQGVCWEKSIKGKSINGLPMHAERAHYGVCRKKCLYRTYVFRTLKVWCQLTHMYES